MTEALSCRSCLAPLSLTDQFCPSCGQRSERDLTAPGDVSDETLRRMTAGLAARYDIAGRIGSGGMAVVYLAIDRRHNRRVALKVMRPEIARAVGQERFLREIEVAAGLQHPHILPVHDSGEVDGALYYVMPFVEGGTLRTRLETGGPLPVNELVPILIEVAGALGHAHAHNVIHRDIKPENVLLSDGHALVADFGVARILRGDTDAPTLTATGLGLGTPGYMAPEQLVDSGRVDGRADLYSLGILGYELLTGTRSFRSATARAVLTRQLAGEPAPLATMRPEVPRWLSDTLSRCVSLDPDDRWPSAAELIKALAAGPSSSPIESAVLASSRWRAPVRAAFRSRGALALGVGVLALAAAVAAVLRKQPEPLPAEPVVRQITFSGKVWRAAISPDGNLIAYVERVASDSFALFVQDLESNAPQSLASVGIPIALQWTPDGRAVLFQDQRDGAHFRVAIVGGTPERLPRDTQRQPNPAGHGVLYWSDSRLLFERDSAPDTVWVDLAPQMTLLQDAKWDPSGERVAVMDVSNDSAGVRNWSVWIVRPPGQVRRKVFGDTIPMSTLAWAPDGRGIYFLHKGASLPELRYQPLSRTDEPAGPQRVVLRNWKAWEQREGFSFGLSRDGRRMSFVQVVPRSNILNPRRQDTTLTAGYPVTTGSSQKYRPLLSTTGDWLAYLDYADDITRLRILALPLGADRTIAESWGLAQMSWFGPGDSLLYCNQAARGGEIWVAAAAGGQPRRLVRQRGLMCHTLLARMADGAILALDEDVSRIVRVTGVDSVAPVTTILGQILDAWASPDGRSLALSWLGTQLDGGISVLTPPETEGKRLVPGLWKLMGWRDNDAVLARRLDQRFKPTGPIVSIVRGTGQVQTWAYPPTDCDEVSISGPGPAVYCVRDESIADAYVIEMNAGKGQSRTR